MIHAWVLGSRGLLGSAISRQLDRQNVNIYHVTESPFNWRNIEILRIQFRFALAKFIDCLTPNDQWEIYWAAGVGAMGSKAEDLHSETIALEEFLMLLQEKISDLSSPGLIGFASSAGAIYSSCVDFEITELSTETAQSDYAFAKLTQEKILRRFLLGKRNISLLVARFSTLYGPGQSSGKQQGLLSHIARCALKHQPVQIFVPLDTLRDYMFSDDAALTFVRSLRLLRADDCKFRMKIISSERSVTIAEIISTFNRLMQKRVPLVFNRNNLSTLYAPRISYRSIYSTKNDIRQHTLIEGIASLILSERAAYINIS